MSIRHWMNLCEGEVVDLKQYKLDKTVADYGAAIQGLYTDERDFFKQGKFIPFARTYIDSHFQADLQPTILLQIGFRDDRPQPAARALIAELRANRFKIEPATKWAKGHRPKVNTSAEPWGPFTSKQIDLPTAREVFANRERSPYGVYQSSRYGFRTAHQNLWDSRGVGFNIVVGGYDHRRGEYNQPYRAEHHIIDNDADMQEVSQMFALIQRAHWRTATE